MVHEQAKEGASKGGQCSCQMGGEPRSCARESNKGQARRGEEATSRLETNPPRRPTRTRQGGRGSVCRMPCITALRLDEHFTKLKATFKEKSRSLREARYAKEFLSYLAYPYAEGALDIAESKSDTERLHYNPKVCHPYMIEPLLHHLPKWTQCCCCRGWLCPRCTDYVGGIDLHQKTCN